MSGTDTRSQSATLCADELASITPPPGFAVAKGAIREAVSRCDREGIRTETVCAALLAELLPRLVTSHGPHGVADMLERLGSELRKLPAVRQ